MELLSLKEVLEVSEPVRMCPKHVRVPHRHVGLGEHSWTVPPPGMEAKSL